MMPAEASMFPCLKLTEPGMFGRTPNIYGTVDGYQALETATGAFSIDNMAGSPVGTEVMKNHRFLFNASLYSTMYQNGATVQAPALSALPCIRY